MINRIDVNGSANRASNSIIDYIDTELAPFINTNVRRYLGTCVSMDDEARTAVVSIAGQTYNIKTIAKHFKAKKTVGRYVSVVLDAQTKALYLDDVIG